MRTPGALIVCALVAAGWAGSGGGNAAADPPSRAGRPAEPPAAPRAQVLPSPVGTLCLLYTPEFLGADLLLADLGRDGLGGAQADLVSPWTTELRGRLPPTPPGRPEVFWPTLPVAPTDHSLPLEEAWRLARKDFKPERVATRLLLRGSPEAVRHLEGVLARLDRPAPSVGVLVLVAEVRCAARCESGGHMSFARQAGTDAGDGIFRGIDGTFEPGAWIRSQATGLLPFPGSTVTFGRFDPLDGAFEHVLRGMALHQQADLAAWPYLVCSESEPCGLEVVSWVPALVLARGQPVPEVNLPPPLDTGLRLGVMAQRVGADGAVLDLHVQLRSAEESPEPDAPPGARVLRARDLKTRATVRDGQSLLLGGVTLTRRLGDRRSFPWAGAVPPVDLVLSGRGSAVERTELLFVLTPRILAADAPPSTGCPTRCGAARSGP